MTEKLTFALVAAAVLAHLASPRVAGAAEAEVPSPQTAILRACDAAGGLEAFSRLGILRIDLTREEITQDGTQSSKTNRLFVVPPGPTPGRLELTDSDVIAADDGTGGWAIQGGAMDARPSTEFMIKRLLHSDLFPTLLPFSLTWDGVTVSAVEPARLGERAVWHLKVVMPTGFFHTPQISPNWSILLDQESYEVVLAESPHVDLGRGIVADGMRFKFSKKVDLGGVSLWSHHTVVGLDPYRDEKAHTRLDQLSFQVLDRGTTPALFVNPVPPDKRPQMQPNVRMRGAPNQPPGS